MKPSKVFFVIGIMLITTIHTNAQTEKLNEINSLSTDIFSLINNINNNVDAFFNAENTKRLIRELDYFQNDLKRYLIARKELMIVLEENNYNIDFKETQLKVNNLKNELKRLSDRLRKISSYVSSNLSSSAMNIIDRIEQAQYSQKKKFTCQD